MFVDGQSLPPAASESNPLLNWEASALSQIFAMTYLRRQFAARKKPWSMELPADLTKTRRHPANHGGGCHEEMLQTLVESFGHSDFDGPHSDLSRRACRENQTHHLCL